MRCSTRELAVNPPFPLVRQSPPAADASHERGAFLGSPDVSYQKSWLVRCPGEFPTPPGQRGASARALTPIVYCTGRGGCNAILRRNRSLEVRRTALIHHSARCAGSGWRQLNRGRASPTTRRPGRSRQRCDDEPTSNAAVQQQQNPRSAQGQPGGLRVSYLAFSSTSARRQRLVADSGRVSASSTRSPTPA